jgi:azurin
MTIHNIVIGFLLATGLAITSCGNGVTDDPLTGTWSNTDCFGSSSKPADVESCSTTLTFTNDLDVQLTASWISLAATKTHPGCTTTKVVTGQQWSAEHATDTFTVTGKGTATVERTDCVNSADDMKATGTTDISIPTGDTKYTISGDTLSVQSGPLEGTYHR